MAVKSNSSLQGSRQVYSFNSEVAYFRTGVFTFLSGLGLLRTVKMVVLLLQAQECYLNALQHQVLCTHVMASRLVLYRICEWVKYMKKRTGTLVLVPIRMRFWVCFSFYWFVLSNFNGM